MLFSLFLPLFPNHLKVNTFFYYYVYELRFYLPYACALDSNMFSDTASLISGMKRKKDSVARRLEQIKKKKEGVHDTSGAVSLGEGQIPVPPTTASQAESSIPPEARQKHIPSES